MTTHYKFDRHSGIVDIEGKILLQLVPVSCSKKFREMAGKELANKLNTIEQGKEAAMRRQRIIEANAECPHPTPRQDELEQVALQWESLATEAERGPTHRPIAADPG